MESGRSLSEQLAQRDGDEFVFKSAIWDSLNRREKLRGREAEPPRQCVPRQSLATEGLLAVGTYETVRLNN